MASRKLARLGSRIRFLVSAILQKEMSDPRLGFITVLKVELTDDLKEARIFYSVLGDAAVKSRTEHALASARGFIQKEVGKNLDTRNTPQLRFYRDETQERLARVETLIERAVIEDRDTSHGQEAEQENG